MLLRYSRKWVRGLGQCGLQENTVLTKCPLGYPLETCVMFCAVIREETRVLLLMGSLWHISHCISVAMRGKPPGSCQSAPDVRGCTVCCDDRSYQGSCGGEESSDEQIHCMWKERGPKEVLQPGKQHMGSFSIYDSSVPKGYPNVSPLSRPFPCTII